MCRCWNAQRGKTIYCLGTSATLRGRMVRRPQKRTERYLYQGHGMWTRKLITWLASGNYKIHWTQNVQELWRNNYKIKRKEIIKKQFQRSVNDMTSMKKMRKITYTWHDKHDIYDTTWHTRNYKHDIKKLTWHTRNDIHDMAYMTNIICNDTQDTTYTWRDIHDMTWHTWYDMHGIT